MDCEKFEAAMMDELYGELDELTSAALKRHASGCTRCTELLAGLRATRQLAALPEVEPPPGLEARILAATAEASKVVPIGRRLARGVSLAGSWAMRPQTAMAAVFLVMIGTSVLLLTGKATRAPISASVTVTEQGSPAVAVAPPEATATASALPATAMATPPGAAAAPIGAASALARADIPPKDESAHASARAAGPAKKADDLDPSGLAGAGAGAAPSPTTAMAGGLAERDGVSTGNDRRGSPFNTAIQAYQSGQYDDAVRQFDALTGDPNAELWAARSVRESKGCRFALARFDRVAQHAAGSPPGWDGLLEGALCYRSIGDLGNARTRLSALLGVDSHKDRARAELDRMNQSQSGYGGGGAGAAKAAAPAPAAPPAPATRPPAASVDQSY